MSRLTPWEIQDYHTEVINNETGWIANWHRNYNKEKIIIINILLTDNYDSVYDIYDMLPENPFGIMASWSTFFLNNLKESINIKKYNKAKETNPEWFI